MKIKLRILQSLALVYVISSMIVTLLPSASNAQETSRSVEVVGESEAEVKPDVAQLTARLFGTGKTAIKAYKTFQSQKESFNTAINPMMFEDLALKYEGVKTSQMPPTAAAEGVVAFGGAAPVAPKVGEGEFMIAEEVRVRLNGLGGKNAGEVETEIMKLVDTAKEAKVVLIQGGGASPFMPQVASTQPVAKYTLSKELLRDTRARNYKKALQDAKARAQTLADLSGAKLGRVLTIVEGKADAAEASPNNQLAAIYGMSVPEAVPYMVDQFGKIKVNVKIRVKFELLDK